jgi:hypothetical protein
MATFVLAQIDAAIDLFTSLTQHGTSTPRYHRNLQWLLKLRVRASSKISTMASTTAKADSQRDTDPDRRKGSEDRGEGEDVELIGWRTRLIERADRLTIRTIHFATAPTDSRFTDTSNQPPNQNYAELSQGQPRLAEMIPPSILLPMVTPDSTNDLVRSNDRSLLMA